MVKPSQGPTVDFCINHAFFEFRKITVARQKDVTAAIQTVASLPQKKSATHCWIALYALTFIN
jgi:hypothetical protein